MANPIIVKQTFPCTAARLWQAITQPDEMRQWFFAEMEDFKAEAGFETKFTISFEDLKFIHHWTILKVVPEKLITYDWRYDGFSGAGKVHFKLSPQGEETLLELINEGIETFPQDIPAFQAESCEAGWQYFIQDRLKNYINQTI